MSAHTTIIDQETATRLSAEFHRCFSDFDARPGLFAADTFFDFLPPMWRFQFEGPGEAFTSQLRSIAEGPVEVEVISNGTEAQLAVTDHGVGLTQQEVTQVFTRFWRADPSRVRRLGGTGLGLSIALGDARAHGGTLSASGAPGAGATFTLRLPLAPEGVVLA